MFINASTEDPAVSDLYAADLDGDGYVNNLTRVWAWRPEVKAACLAARDVLLKNEFEDVIARTFQTNQPAHARTTTTATSGGPVPPADGRLWRLRPRFFCACH